MSKDEVKIQFEREFGPVKHLFHPYFSYKPIEVDYSRPKPGHVDWSRPGIYVFLRKGDVIKVGKSQDNSFKRSLQHMRDSDNTSSKDGSVQMRHFRQDRDVEVILFNIKKNEDIHWVLALEYFLEHRLEPVIRSVRSG